MKTFRTYVSQQKVIECAELMCFAGIDSRAYCESVEYRVKHTLRAGRPLHEAFQVNEVGDAWWNPFTNKGSAGNPLKWGAKTTAGGVLTGQTNDPEALADREGKQTWTNTARKVGGGIRGFFSGLKSMANGMGYGAGYNVAKMQTIVGGAVKDIQNLMANLNNLDKSYQAKDAEGNMMPGPMHQKREELGGHTYLQMLAGMTKELTQNLGQQKHNYQGRADAANNSWRADMGLPPAGPTSPGLPFSRGEDGTLARRAAAASPDAAPATGGSTPVLPDDLELAPDGIPMATAAPDTPTATPAPTPGAGGIPDDIGLAPEGPRTGTTPPDRRRRRSGFGSFAG